MKEIQNNINKKFGLLAEKEGLLSIKVTPFYQKKITEEIATLSRHDGPLHRIAFPTEDRLVTRAPGESADFVDDRRNMPPGLEGFAIRKYADRMLFFPTDVCAGHCQYCFREDVLSELHKQRDLPASLTFRLERLTEYLRKNPEIQEVILSGGDPMVLPTLQLQTIFEALQKAGIKHIRIHTRCLVYAPRVFKPETIKLLASMNVRVVHHVVHPYEICDEVRGYCSQMGAAGIRQYSQFPLLRGVNDHQDVLRRLLTEMDALGIRTLSIFVPDPIKYSACFRVRLKRLFSIVDQLNQNSPAWINSVRVVLDTPYGKVRRENLVSYDESADRATFRKGDQLIQFPDLPEHLDVPADLRLLLWRDFPPEKEMNRTTSARSEERQ